MATDAPAGRGPIPLETIGVARTPFRALSGMPVQPAGAREVEGEIHVDPRYAAGLADLAGFSHIHLLYHFHAATRTELAVIPFLDVVPRGVFATRSPLRPSRLGLSTVELLAVEGCVVRVRGIDLLDGTPVFDIKPYVPAFDERPGASSGWMGADRDEVGRARSDGRFA